MAGTFDPAFNPSAFTLSNGNLTATATTSTQNNVRATNAAFTTGKIYYEATFVSGNVNAGFSIANGNAGTGDVGAAGAAHGLKWAGTGNVYSNGVSVATVSTFTNGNIICVAVDVANQAAWFRLGSNNWNLSGTANPATNTGGISLAAVIANNGTLYPAFSNQASGDQLTINLGGSAFAQTVPSGFAAPGAGGTVQARVLVLA